MKKYQKSIVLGTVIGLLLPFVGLFVGLQVSASAGTVLAFPLVLLVLLSGVSIGNMGAWIILGFLLSAAMWSIVFVLIQKFFFDTREQCDISFT